MSLRGAFPVLPTLFEDTDRPAIRDFESAIDFALACGVDGVVYPGTASEVATLSDEERAMLTALVGRRLNGRVPFVCGATHRDPRVALAHAKRGADAGAAAAMAMAPDGLSTAELIAYFRTVGDAPIPIMLQNAPRPYGAGLAPEQAAEIVAAVPAIRFAKEETLPCGQNLSRLAAAAGDRLDAVFGGAGGRYITDELARGAAGTVPALELADVHVRLVRAHFAGDTREARRLFAASLPLLNLQAVFRTHMTKFVLACRGVIKNTRVRAADPPLDDQDRAELSLLLEEAAPLFAIHPPMDRAA